MTGTADARTLTTVVAHGLRGDEPVTLTDSEADTLLAQARAARVDGLLAAAIADGAIAMSTRLADQAVEQAQAALRTSLAAEAAAVELCDALADAAVDARVLKGVAHAHLDEADPALRVFGDADLLVRPDALTTGLAAARRIGFQRSTPPIRPGWERRFGKSVVVRRSGAEIDLHIRLSDGWFGHHPPVTSLFDRAGESFAIGGRRLVALSPGDRLVHAAIHAVIGHGARWRAHRDIAVMCIRHQAWRHLDGAHVDHSARVIAAAAIADTWELLALDPQHPAAGWAATIEPTVHERAAMDAVDYRARARTLLGGLGLVDRGRFVAGLLVPSREFRRHRRNGGEL